MNTETKAVSPQQSDPLFDQFKLSEEFNGNHHYSGRAMRILRKLRNKGPITENELAIAVNEKRFLYEWSYILARLAQIGYIKSELTEKSAKLVSLTEQGEEFLFDKLGVKIPEPKPVVEQPTEPQQPGKYFKQIHQEVLGQPFTTKE